MGESSSETVREIEDVRGHLEGEIQALEERLPKPPAAKNLVGVVAGAGLAALTLKTLLKKGRRRKSSKIEEIKEQASDLPDQIRESLEGADWKPVAAAIGGLWVVFRLMEIRQLKRLSRAFKYRD